MQLYRLLVLLVALTLATAQEEPDPCLAEDYAEANCAPAFAGYKDDPTLTEWAISRSLRRHVLRAGRLQAAGPRVRVYNFSLACYALLSGAAVSCAQHDLQDNRAQGEGQEGAVGRTQLGLSRMQRTRDAGRTLSRGLRFGVWSSCPRVGVWRGEDRRA